MNNKEDLNRIDVGVVGLGLMGTSIVASLLISGHPVKAIAALPEDLDFAFERIHEQLKYCQEAGLLEQPVGFLESRLLITDNYSLLADCEIVFECVIEDASIKAKVYDNIEKAVKKDTIIASNTSAIAITTLQELVKEPGRFMGIHWSEPAFTTRFMEITCGKETKTENAEWIFEIAHKWGKEPTLLRKDIRGFITNRLMYAVYREIFSLIDKGAAGLEEVDKAFRYDPGSWITLMGIFRRMDYVGLNDFTEILKNIIPTLSNDEKVPPLMQKMVDQNARGIQNLKGLYNYTEGEARAWQKAFALFNKDIYELASYYPIIRNRVKEKSSL